MFDYLKLMFRSANVDDETGTYADALLNVPTIQLQTNNAREYGHEAHARDYGSSRQVHRSAFGYA